MKANYLYYTIIITLLKVSYIHIIPTYQLKFYRKCKSFQHNIVPITEIIIIDFFHKYDNELKKVQRPNIQKFILTYQNICTSILLNVTSVMLTANTFD